MIISKGELFSYYSTFKLEFGNFEISSLTSDRRRYLYQYMMNRLPYTAKYDCSQQMTMRITMTKFL